MINELWAISIKHLDFADYRNLALTGKRFYKLITTIDFYAGTGIILRNYLMDRGYISFILRTEVGDFIKLNNCNFLSKMLKWIEKVKQRKVRAYIYILCGANYRLLYRDTELINEYEKRKVKNLLEIKMNSV